MTVILLACVLTVPIAYFARFWRQVYFLDCINTLWAPYLLFGFYQPMSSLSAWREIYGEDVINTAILMYLIAGIGVILGYRGNVGVRLGDKLPIKNGVDINERYAALASCLLVAGVAGFIHMVQVSGGLDSYLSTSRTAINYEELSAYELTLQGFIPVALCLLLCVSMQRRRYTRFKHLVLIGFAILLGWEVYSGTRLGIMTTSVLILGGYFGAKRRNPPKAVVLASIVAVVFLVGFTSAFRGVMFGGRINLDLTAEEALSRSFSVFGDHGINDSAPIGCEFSMACAVISNVPARLPYDKGFLLLELLTRPIPRALWPEKKYPEGEAWNALHEIAGTASWRNAAGLLSGPAPGLVGKYYYIGGIIGVIVGSIVTGIFLRMVDRYSSRVVGVTGLFIAGSVAMFGFSEMNNPLLWPMVWVPNSGMCVLLGVGICRRGAWVIGSRKRRSRANLNKIGNTDKWSNPTTIWGTSEVLDLVASPNTNLGAKNVSARENGEAK